MNYQWALSLVLSCSVAPLSGCSRAVVASTPATVAEASAKLDLETLPLPEGAEMSRYRRAADLGYSTKQPAQQAFGFVDKQLTERGWKQLPDAQISDEFANVDYQLDGYLVSLSVSPRQPGQMGVMLTHKGNVALEDVPVPDHVEKLYAFPAVVMYKSPDSVEKTTQACHERMLAAGWSPYGGAGDVAYYRQNAVQVDLNVMSAPGQGGATVISVTSKMLSLELPAPPFADDFRYSDGTTAIEFDTDKTPQEVGDFYSEQLASTGWQRTTDEPVEIKWKKYTILRNEGQEMITIATHDFEGRTRVYLDHENASEVAKKELLGLVSAGEKAKYGDQEWIPVEVAIPGSLKTEKLEDWAFKIATPRKEAFATAEAITKSLLAAGWTSTDKASDKATEKPAIRTRRFEGQDRILHLIALEPPKLESWVAVVGVGGVTLNPAK